MFVECSNCACTWPLDDEDTEGIEVDMLEEGERFPRLVLCPDCEEVISATVIEQ